MSYSNFSGNPNDNSQNFRKPMTFGQYLQAQKFATSKMTLGEYYESQSLDYINFGSDHFDFGSQDSFDKNFETNCNHFQNSYINYFECSPENNFQTSQFQESAPRPMTFDEGLRMLENERIENRYREENRCWEHELDLLFESNDDFSSETSEVKDCFDPNEEFVPTISK